MLTPAAASSSGGPPGGARARAKTLCEGQDGAQCMFSEQVQGGRCRARNQKTTCAWCSDDLVLSRDNFNARGRARRQLQLLAGGAEKEALRRAPRLTDKAPAIAYGQADST